MNHESCKSAIIQPKVAMTVTASEKPDWQFVSRQLQGKALFVSFATMLPQLLLRGCTPWFVSAGSSIWVPCHPDPVDPAHQRQHDFTVEVTLQGRKHKFLSSSNEHALAACLAMLWILESGDCSTQPAIRQLLEGQKIWSFKPLVPKM